MESTSVERFLAFLDGGLFKADIHVANGAILIETWKKHIEMENKAKESKEQKDNNKVDSNDMSALNFYQKWVKDGKHVCDNRYPELIKNILSSITKVFLESTDASIATYGNRYDYLTINKCEQSPVELKGGKNWYMNMESL